MKKICKILTSSGFIKYIGVLCICMTIFVTCIQASADTLDLGDGVFQEIPSDENVDEMEYIGSQEDSKDPIEGTQEPEEGTTEDYEGSTQANQENEVPDQGKQEPEEGTTEDYEGSTQGNQQIDQGTNLENQAELDILNNIDNSIKKLTISLWSLFGLLLGTKLIKGLFGYGG